MFSSTTMESSTTRPMATIIPPRVRMLSVIPCHHKTISATSSDRGIEIAATTVARALRKKTKMTSTAKTAPSKPSRRMSLIACVIGVAWSWIESKCTPLPTDFSIPGIAFHTSLATVTVFVFGPLTMRRPMLSLPLVRVIVSAGTDTTATVPS